MFERSSGTISESHLHFCITESGRGKKSSTMYTKNHNIILITRYLF